MSSAERTATAAPDAAARSERAARLARYLEQARSGDSSAVQEIVRELTPLLWHVARSQGLATEQAADVVQTTWLELLRHLHEIRTPQALAGWLATAAKREAWRVQRQDRRHGDLDDEVETLADPAPEAADGLIREERHGVLLHHFRQLSQRCQELLRIVAQVDRPDYDVVSQSLSMPRGSIGPTRGRCLAQLREKLLADPAWSPA